MAEPAEIFQAIAGVLSRRQQTGDLAGCRVLVTAGPTQEPIDAVRFVGNRSSGKMGFAVAFEAARRGAVVTLVSGPVAVQDPPGVQVVRVETADDMAREVLGRFEEMDAVVMAAAVADFRPARTHVGKLKKDHGTPEIALEPTIDILATLGKQKEHQVLVGFAAETDDLEEEGRRKLTEKNLDVIVVNEVGKPDTGFGSDTNRAAILAKIGAEAPLRRWTKAELASAVCDRLASLLPTR